MTAPPLVLVVDDEPEVHDPICELLEGEGYRTRALHSGTVARELIPTVRPVLVLLDVYLPAPDGDTAASTTARLLRAVRRALRGSEEPQP